LEVHQDDIELLERYGKNGDLRILGQLYERYMHLVFGVCMKYLKDREIARDAVMDIFESLPEKIRKHEIRNFKSWLHVLTKNHCLMLLRSARYKKEQQAEEITDYHMESADLLHHDNGVGLESDLRALKKCIETLNAEQKTCVQLFFLEERSYREIAAHTAYDLKKVKSHIQNGKRNLKNCMEKQREA